MKAAVYEASTFQKLLASVLVGYRCFCRLRSVSLREHDTLNVITRFTATDHSLTTAPTEEE